MKPGESLPEESAHPEANRPSLGEVIERFARSPFLLVEPGGNFGDYLIYKGAQSLMRLHHVSYRNLKHREFMASDIPRDSVVYIHGGGGLVPWWSGTPMQELKRALRAHTGPVILGPQSVHNDAAYVREVLSDVLAQSRASEVFLFARERTSFSLLRENAPSWVSVGLDHDTAFSAQASDLLRCRPRRSFQLHAIRSDKEGLGHDPASSGAVVLDPVRYCRDFDHWVYVHARARSLVTDRLHSAILASILGIPTTLLPNSYHKNRSVWEFSLAARGVAWADRETIQRTEAEADMKGSRARAMVWLARAARRSFHLLPPQIPRFIQQGLTCTKDAGE